MGENNRAQLVGEKKFHAPENSPISPPRASFKK